MIAVVPQRRLVLEGAYNVRDIGGYATVDGRQTRWRTLLRGDSLHRLNSAGQAALLVGWGDARSHANSGDCITR